MTNIPIEAVEAALNAWDDVYDGVSHNKADAIQAALLAALPAGESQ